MNLFIFSNDKAATTVICLKHLHEMITSDLISPSSHAVFTFCCCNPLLYIPFFHYTVSMYQVGVSLEYHLDRSQKSQQIQIHLKVEPP